MAESGSTQNLIDRIANLNLENQKAQQEKLETSICKSSDQINESPLLTATVTLSFSSTIINMI